MGWQVPRALLLRVRMLACLQDFTLRSGSLHRRAVDGNHLSWLLHGSAHHRNSPLGFILHTHRGKGD